MAAKENAKQEDSTTTWDKMQALWADANASNQQNWADYAAGEQRVFQEYMTAWCDLMDKEPEDAEAAEEAMRKIAEKYAEDWNKNWDAFQDGHAKLYREYFATLQEAVKNIDAHEDNWQDLSAVGMAYAALAAYPPVRTIC